MESETFFDAVNAKHFEDRQFVTDVSIEHDVKSRESLVPVFELHGREFELVVDHREVLDDDLGWYRRATPPFITLAAALSHPD
jgi:hypothetical protein